MADTWRKKGKYVTIECRRFNANSRTFIHYSLFIYMPRLEITIGERGRERERLKLVVSGLKYSLQSEKLENSGGEIRCGFVM